MDSAENRLPMHLRGRRLLRARDLPKGQVFVEVTIKELHTSARFPKHVYAVAEFAEPAFAKLGWELGERDVRILGLKYSCGLNPDLNDLAEKLRGQRIVLRLGE